MSYICFLALTWWIWASQVLYNVRFRQRDWLHHGFVILQLLTLCALAAFSGGFDISQGIVSDTEPADMPSLASNTQFFISGSSAIVDARSNFLSRVNSTGISCVLLCSRVLILLQYCRGIPIFEYCFTSLVTHSCMFRFIQCGVAPNAPTIRTRMRSRMQLALTS